MDQNFPSFAARDTLIPSPNVNEKDTNPSNSQDDRITEQRTRRIPMSAPQAKLATPAIPGFHLHWVNDYPGRILQAQQGGYEFVEKDETFVNTRDFAGSSEESGSTDLGTRVSVVVGTSEKGEPLRAYLMKIREEWYEEDQRAAQNRVDAVEDAMSQGKQKAEGMGADRGSRYVKTLNMKSTYSRSG